VFYKVSGALACLLVLTAVPASFASGSSWLVPPKSKSHQVCRVLPASAQPKRAPAASRRVQQRTEVAAETIMVVVPSTTCNHRS
jgi:hypothetical protein